MGWVPAVALYTVFGALSGYTEYQLWRMFIQMDSDRYPKKDFGDFGFRVFGILFIGRTFRFFCTNCVNHPLSIVLPRPVEFSICDITEAVVILAKIGNCERESSSFHVRKCAHSPRVN